LNSDVFFLPKLLRCVIIVIGDIDMLDIKTIADAIPELPEESTDPKAQIVEVQAFGGSLILDPLISHDSHGTFPLRRAYKILKKIQMEKGGWHFYLR
jgi:hypothetical protein